MLDGEPVEDQGEEAFGHGELDLLRCSLHVLIRLVPRHRHHAKCGRTSIHPALTISAHHQTLQRNLSLVASTGGVTLLPAYVESPLPSSVVRRSLAGNASVIEIAVGYRTDNPSPILNFFLENFDQLIASWSIGQRPGRR